MLIFLEITRDFILRSACSGNHFKVSFIWGPKFISLDSEGLAAARLHCSRKNIIMSPHIASMLCLSESIIGTSISQRRYGVIDSCILFLYTISFDIFTLSIYNQFICQLNEILTGWSRLASFTVCLSCKLSDVSVIWSSADMISEFLATRKYSESHIIYSIIAQYLQQEMFSIYRFL